MDENNRYKELCAIYGDLKIQEEILQAKIIEVKQGIAQELNKQRQPVKVISNDQKGGITAGKVVQVEAKDKSK